MDTTNTNSNSTNNITLILGSSSPRRIELVNKIDFINDIKIIKPNIDERILDCYFFINKEKLNIKEYPLKEAILKANSILSSVKKLENNEILLTLDTAIIFNNKIYNKPLNKEDAFNTLKEFSSNYHECITGYNIIYKDKNIKKSVTTKVYFNELNDELINKYINEINILDKAGSYAIQDDASYHLINKIEGSYYNVIGFPLEDIIEELKKILD